MRMTVSRTCDRCLLNWRSTFHNQTYVEVATTLLSSSNRIEGGEVLHRKNIRKKQVTEGLKAQDNSPIPYHQLGRHHMIMAQNVADEACHKELQSQIQYLRMKVYTSSLEQLCIIGVWRTPFHLDVWWQTDVILHQVVINLLLATEDLRCWIKIHGHPGMMLSSLPFSFNSGHGRTRKVGSLEDLGAKTESKTTKSF